MHDFLILEKAATLGGTWRDNTYPGASCDAPSFLYSFSFAQKTDWSRRFAWQPELLGYSHRTRDPARPAAALPVQYRSDRAIVYDDSANTWTLDAAPTARQLDADFVVTGVGQLNRPSTPAIAGHGHLRRARSSIRRSGTMRST